MKLATAEETRRIDELALERFRVPGVAMMEDSGSQAAALLRREWPDARRVLVLCGSGNNGGDGYVVARHLAARGLQVHVIAMGSPPRVDAAVMAEAWTKSGGAIERPADGALARRVAEESAKADVIVDAMLGTGAKSAPRPPLSLAIEALPADARVLALDIPSGVDVTTGEVPGACVHATVTVTFGIGKLGLCSHPGARFAGRVVLAEIGWPAGALDAVPVGGELLSGESVRGLLAPLDEEAHKGDRGHVLVVAGRDNRPGAAALSCHAAFRAGAGTVTLASTPAVADAVVTAVPEVMVESFRAGKGALSAKAAAAIASLAAKADALVIGPGVGLEQGPQAVLAALLAKPGAPAVLDADALTLLASGKSKTRAKRECVLTPHPGEMGRLLGIDAADVQAARLRCAREAAVKYGAHVVLKGARTVVAEASGAKLAVNATGNSGLATAGAGDVLAGVVAAWIARGVEPWAAARAAVWAHGAAADLAAKDIGPAGFLARDVADRIPAVVPRLESRESKPRRPRPSREKKQRRA